MMATKRKKAPKKHSSKTPKRRYVEVQIPSVHDALSALGMAAVAVDDRRLERIALAIALARHAGDDDALKVLDRAAADALKSARRRAERDWKKHGVVGRQADAIQPLLRYGQSGVGITPAQGWELYAAAREAMKTGESAVGAAARVASLAVLFAPGRVRRTGRKRLIEEAQAAAGRLEDSASPARVVGCVLRSMGLDADASRVLSGIRQRRRRKRD